MRCFIFLFAHPRHVIKIRYGANKHKLSNNKKSGPQNKTAKGAFTVSGLPCRTPKKQKTKKQLLVYYEPAILFRSFSMFLIKPQKFK